MDIMQMAASLGGIGGLLAVIVIYLYRQDRKDTLQQLRTDRKYMEDRLTILIAEDQKSREDNTHVLTQLTILIERLNGKGRQGG